MAGRAPPHSPPLHSQRSLLAQPAGGLVEVCGRLFRRDALAGQSFANPDEIEQATRVATAQLNRRANPWLWGRPRHQLIATIAASFLIAFKERSTRTSAPILQSRASFWREIYGNRGMQGEVIWDRHAAVLDWINDLALAPGSRVLEIGCGAGFMAIALAQRGFRVHAIDSAEGLIMGARRHA